MNNYQHNRLEINRFKKELKNMLGDISDIDAECLTKAVNQGLANAKQNTPVDTGFMRKSWHVTPTKKIKGRGAEKALNNSTDYASFVNDGHRKVNSSGATTGWVNGYFMLQIAINKTTKVLKQEFKKQVEKVNRKYDK